MNAYIVVLEMTKRFLKFLSVYHYFSESRNKIISRSYFSIVALSLLCISCISDYTEDQKYIKPPVIAGGGEVLLPVAVANELLLEKRRTKIDFEVFEEQGCLVPHSLSQIKISMLPVKEKYRENAVSFNLKKRKDRQYFDIARGIKYRILAYHEAKKKGLFEKIMTINEDELSLSIILKCLN